MLIRLIIKSRCEGVLGDVDEILVDSIERIVHGLLVVIDVADNVRQII